MPDGVYADAPDPTDIDTVQNKDVADRPLSQLEMTRIFMNDCGIRREPAADLALFMWERFGATVKDRGYVRKVGMLYRKQQAPGNDALERWADDKSLPLLQEFGVIG